MAQKYGAILAALVLFVAVRLALSAEDDLIQWVIAAAIALVSFTLCGAIGVMCIRLLQVNTTKPLTPSSVEGQFALLAGSVALFGILITGVFVITALRVEDNATAVATEAANRRLNVVVDSHQRQMASFQRAHDTEIAQMRNEHMRLMDRISSEHAQAMGDLRELVRTGLARAAQQAAPLRRGTVTESTNDLIGTDGEPRQLVFLEDQVRALEFTVRETATYRIDAMARTEGFDPYLYLYQGEQVIYDDDDGGGGLNARLEVELEPGVYRIEVEELWGDEGICVVTAYELR